jgi:hypothetical protein
MTPDAANCYAGPPRDPQLPAITHCSTPDVGACRCVYSAETTTLPNYHSRNATKKADFKLLFLFVCIPTGHIPMPNFVVECHRQCKTLRANIVLVCVLKAMLFFIVSDNNIDITSSK